MVEMVNFHFAFYIIFSFKHIEMYAKIYFDSDFNGSYSVLFGKMQLWLSKRLY